MQERYRKVLDDWADCIICNGESFVVYDEPEGDVCFHCALAYGAINQYEFMDDSYDNEEQKEKYHTRLIERLK